MMKKIDANACFFKRIGSAKFVHLIVREHNQLNVNGVNIDVEMDNEPVGRIALTTHGCSEFVETILNLLAESDDKFKAALAGIEKYQDEQYARFEARQKEAM